MLSGGVIIEEGEIKGVAAVAAGSALHGSGTTWAKKSNTRSIHFLFEKTPHTAKMLMNAMTRNSGNGSSFF
jgi:hypothetical protein